MIKGSIPARKYNICKPLYTKHKAPKYIRQILSDLEEEIDSNKITVGDFSIHPFLSINRLPRQKTNKETSALSDPLDQTYLIDVYRTFHPKPAKYTVFTSAPGTFSKIHHIRLGQRKTEITSGIFSNLMRKKLEINYKKKIGQSRNMWRLNNIPSKQWSTKKLKGIT